MKRLGLTIVTAFAILGALALVNGILVAVRQHYAVSCVDNDATDYGFEFRKNTASLTRK